MSSAINPVSSFSIGLLFIDRVRALIYRLDLAFTIGTRVLFRRSTRVFCIEFTGR